MVHARLAILLARTLDLEHLLVLEQPHHVDHRLGVVTEIIDVPGAKRVGLELHVATVAGDQCRARDIGDVGEAPAACKHRDQRCPDAGRGGAGLLPHCVTP